MQEPSLSEGSCSAAEAAALQDPSERERETDFMGHI